MAKLTPRKTIIRRKPVQSGRPGVGKGLVATRRMKGWSQSKAAKYIGITALELRGLEKREHLGPAEEILVDIADVYATSLDCIYGRSESAIERFTSAAPEGQSAMLSGIMNGIALLTHIPDALRYIDELATMAADELADWSSFQAYRESPTQQRMAMLEQVAQAISRLVRNRDALKYVVAIVMQFAHKAGIGPATPVNTYSPERLKQALTRNLTNIDQSFRHKKRMKPSRYNVDEAPIDKLGKRKKTAKRVKKPSRKK